MTGPYGITFSDDDATLMHTGYDYTTVEAAREDAKRVLVDGKPGSLKVDELTAGGMERKPLYAYIENEDDSIEEWYHNHGQPPVAYVINGRRRVLFENDDGIVPTCDFCEGPQLAEGDDWNGETGCHFSCEERRRRYGDGYDVADLGVRP